ncbi:alpha/beta hydrolase [Maricaulis parjimensis]|uniref:alpha/beta hydrolase n=1 Tax=Maricaulis parjimensis TaxID=144023 RepID=UPI001939668A|nr:alpha/beta hydrolase-fold protein [Maricaulis parjimensis]
MSIMLAGLFSLALQSSEPPAQPDSEIAALAETLEPRDFNYPYRVEVLDLPTAPNGINYRLYVRPPLRRPAEGEQSSSVYLLDARQLFTPAASMSYNQEYFDYIPSSYFIGIGYQEDGEDSFDEFDRTRDYTPTSFTPDEDHFLYNSPQDWEGSGGADAFFDYVETTIIPLVEARYDVSPSDRVLVGKSTSGLGATYALLERPGLFNRYVIISPALWWDDWLRPRHERWVMRAEVATRETEYPVETRVYLAAGEGEHTFGLATDVFVLFDALRSRRDDNLKLNAELLPGEQHESVFPAAFMRGLIGVYSDRRESASPFDW